MSDYQFTEYYFGHLVEIWTALFAANRSPIKKVLEIGSFEGGSAVWILEKLMRGGGELHCVDTWRGGIEHQAANMAEVERRFDSNIEIARRKTSGTSVVKHKGESARILAQLIAADHTGSFDFIYVDGGHESHMVLSDLVGAFQLCKVGGLIICDDYLWGYEDNLRFSPKLAIDSFLNCYNNKVQIVLKAPLYQMYFTKIRD